MNNKNGIGAPMNISSQLKFSGVALTLILLSGCAINSELAPTTPDNLLYRSSIEAKDFKFFRAANPTEFESCVKANLLDPMCETREIAVGEPFDAIQFSISIKDRSSFASEAVRDYSMYLAGALSKKLGYEYFTTINISDIGNCSSSPSAYSYGTVNDNGSYYGTTNITNNTRCANLYTTTHFSFNSYDPLKSGILVQYSQQRKPQIHPDLYFTIADRIDAIKRARSSALGSSDLVDQYQRHPIDAWKYYFPSQRTVQSAAEKHGLPLNPDVTSIIKKEREMEKIRDLRKELIIKGQ